MDSAEENNRASVPFDKVNPFYDVKYLTELHLGNP